MGELYAYPAGKAWCVHGGAAGHWKRLGSPAPTRRISGSGSEKSTTVVGTTLQSPASTTASTA